MEAAQPCQGVLDSSARVEVESEAERDVGGHVPTPTESVIFRYRRRASESELGTFIIKWYFKKENVYNAQQVNMSTNDTIPTASSNLSADLLPKLDQLVQYCAQILQQSRRLKSLGPDLEHNAIPEPNPPASTSQNGLRSPPLGLALGRDNAEIWEYNKPWSIQQVQTSSDQETGDGQGQILRYKISTRKETLLLFPPLRQVFPLEVNYGVLVATFTRPRDSFGGILEECYRHRVLQQPASSDLNAYMSQVWIVIGTALLINNIFMDKSRSGYKNESRKEVLKNHYDALVRVNWKLSRFFEDHTLEQILGVIVPQVMQVLYGLEPAPFQLPFSTGPIMRVDDLDIKSLQQIGGLSLRWTIVLEEHLKLDLKNMTLSVLWHELPHPIIGDCCARKWNCIEEFQVKSIVDSPTPGLLYVCKKVMLSTSPTFLDMITRFKEDWPLNTEIARSWYFLFGVHRKKRSGIELFYNGLPRPPWATESTTNSQREKHFGKCHPFRSDDEDYEAFLQTATNPEEVPFSEFKILERRLRQLRFYMDSRHPRNFMELWHDNRDVLSYYTVWGALLFGAITIILAFLSLGFSAAQTVASFRALG